MGKWAVAVVILGLVLGAVPAILLIFLVWAHGTFTIGMPRHWLQLLELLAASGAICVCLGAWLLWRNRNAAQGYV